ncbi:MAG: helix-turn-helix transcriptional regulator [Thermoanaerobaculia bacterium]
MPLDVRLKPIETLLFSSDIVAIGKFRCPSGHPLFRDSGPCTHHTFVFPRTATEIRHAGGPSFVGSPNSVSLYNQNQRYTRSPISAIDASDWFVIADDVLRDAIASFDPSVHDRPMHPFRRSSAPIDTTTYAAQRQLFQRVEAGDCDANGIDEEALRIFSSVMTAAQEGPPVANPAMRDAVETVKRIIAGAPSRNVGLRTLAAQTGSSPFQLCRAFRRLTGMTMTGFRHSLRIRIALDRLRDHRTDLTDLALDLGYASHSHFSASFRRQVGITPSQFRATA